MNFHTDPLPEPAAQRLRTLKLLSIALIVGVAMFAGIVASIGPIASALDPNTLNILRMACGVLLVSALVVAIVLRQSARTKLAAMQPPPDDAIRMNYFAGVTIITMAVFEGPALLACVVALLSHNQLDLVLAMPPLLLMLWFIPTESRWRSFARSAHEPFASR